MDESCSHLTCFFQSTSKCLDMFLAGAELSVSCIMNVTGHCCAPQPSSGWQVGDIITIGFKREAEKTTCRAFEIQFHRRSKLIPLTPANRHILIITSTSHTPSCVEDNINRDGQQLPPRGAVSSWCPQACQPRRESRQWQWEKWRAMKATSKHEADTMCTSITGSEAEREENGANRRQTEFTK